MTSATERKDKNYLGYIHYQNDDGTWMVILRNNMFQCIGVPLEHSSNGPQIAIQLLKSTYKEKPEYIEAAAIMWNDQNGFPHIVLGRSHADCIWCFSELGLLARNRSNEQQGFFTTHDRFLTRHEAYRLALRTKQVKNTAHSAMCVSEELYSEWVTYKPRE